MKKRYKPEGEIKDALHVIHLYVSGLVSEEELERVLTAARKSEQWGCFSKLIKVLAGDKYESTVKKFVE